MGDIGYRRKGDSTPLYNPERDYAYITPTLMRLAIELLDAKEPPEKVKWRLENDITQAAIAKIAETLAMAQSDFVNAADPVTSFEAALERHGFFNFNYAVRQFLFSSIGEVFCAAWFTAVREVSVVGDDSPAAVDMARFSAAVRSFVSNVGLPAYDVNYVAEFKAAQMKTLTARLQIVEKELAQQRNENQRLRAELQQKEVTDSTNKREGLFPRLRRLFRKKQNA